MPPNRWLPRGILLLAASICLLMLVVDIRI